MATYTVRPGDNLSRIAARHNKDVRDVVAANPWIQDPDLIQPGWEIEIPDSPTSPAARQQAANRIATGSISAGSFSPTGRAEDVVSQDQAALFRQLYSQGFAPDVLDLSEGLPVPEVEGLSGTPAQDPRNRIGGAPGAFRPPPAQFSPAPLSSLQADIYATEDAAFQRELRINRQVLVAAREGDPDAIAQLVKMRAADEVALLPTETEDTSTDDPVQFRDITDAQRGGARFRDITDAQRTGRTPAQEEMYQMWRASGYSDQVANRLALQYDPPEHPLGLEELNPFRAAARLGAMVEIWRRLQISIPQELRALEFQLRQQGLSDDEIEQELNRVAMERRAELFERYRGLAEQTFEDDQDDTLEIIANRDAELAGQPPVAGEVVGMQTGTVYAPFQSPDAFMAAQRNRDINIGVAATVIMNDGRRSYEHAHIYADAIQLIAELQNTDGTLSEASLRVLDRMNMTQLSNLISRIQANPELAAAYAEAARGKTREELIQLAIQELTELEYGPMETAPLIFKLPNTDLAETQNQLEDLVFGGVPSRPASRRSGSGRRGGGGGIGGRSRQRAANFALTGVGMYNWRIRA